MRRRSVAVVVQEANTPWVAWPVAAPYDDLVGTGLANGEAWRRPICVNDGFPMVSMWVSHGRATCIAELSAEEGPEESAGLVEGRRRGGIGHPKTTSESRQPWSVRRQRGSRPLQTAEALLASSPHICQRAAGIPRGRAISGLAILATRAAWQRNSRQEEVVLEYAAGREQRWLWWPAFAAIQPPLRNSCECREGYLANRDAGVGTEGELAVGSWGRGSGRASQDSEPLASIKAPTIACEPVTRSGGTCEKGWDGQKDGGQQSEWLEETTRGRVSWKVLGDSKTVSNLRNKTHSGIINIEF
ncbi:hypothetical protein B0T18DRAFT_117364 [Schizothecium vesticola]|uniref:Uncharacterized protein n=1 Tax=Schizothecium vesticola TaxID=314040 RepID=A0AA40F2J3_9PEZI|nr:hypothetical protein B0T18DRAFT_117364 [Schizothecium vesticola]